MTFVELKVRLVVERVALLVVELAEVVVAVLVWLEAVLEEDEPNSVVLLVPLLVMSGMTMVERVLLVELKALDVVAWGTGAGYATTKATITTAPIAAAASAARVLDLDSADIEQTARC